MEPVLQLALDFLELSRALKAAREAVKGGAQWIEAGTPLVKSEGLNSIRALRREWAEELVTDFEPVFTPVGLLNDDTTAVGSVHVGLVYVADAAGQPVTMREVDKLEGAFATTGDVAAVRDDLETWSRLAFDALTE